MSSFDKFLKKFVESFIGKDPMIFSVLGNVFSMRIIGNKTHGDLAEIDEYPIVASKGQNLVFYRFLDFKS